MAENENINRRDFIKEATLTSLGAAFVAIELDATAAPAKPKPAVKPTTIVKPAPTSVAKVIEDEEYMGAPVNCAVIGLGPQGRDILKSLMIMPGKGAKVVAICDTYTKPKFIKRSDEIVSGLTVETDYHKILENKDVQAVFVATPTHLHKQIVVDALAAGKHVYCEAPLANTIEDARAIATAGMSAKSIFWPGIQYRANAMHNHVYNFIRADALGKNIGGRAQWHRRGSWKQVWSETARMDELNWRLRAVSSLGLEGELGIHSMDTANRFLRGLPKSIEGFGQTLAFTEDGMEVPDTVQLMMEYPGGIRFTYDATIASSLDGSYEAFYGTDSSIIVRDLRGWMFKESDAPMLGWEVYAKKETMGIGDTSTGTGIMLVANASKQLALNKEPSKVGTDVSKTALFQSCGHFLNQIRGKKDKIIITPLEGYQATVTAIKAHEAVMSGKKVVIEKSLFTL